MFLPLVVNILLYMHSCLLDDLNQKEINNNEVLLSSCVYVKKQNPEVTFYTVSIFLFSLLTVPLCGNMNRLDTTKCPAAL